jgi:hypothetical protein
MTNAEMRRAILTPLRERVKSCRHDELCADCDLAAARARAATFERRREPAPALFNWPDEIRQRAAALERAAGVLVEAREVLAYAERHLPE